MKKILILCVLLQLCFYSSFSQVVSLPVFPLRPTSPFGPRVHPHTGRMDFHRGVDLKAKRSIIRAVLPGRISSCGQDGVLGNFVRICHGKAESIYGHLSSVLVYPGKEVSAGEMIGVSGHSGRATCEHLHFSLRLDRNAVDPLKFLLSLQVILKKKQNHEKQRQTRASVPSGNPGGDRKDR